VSSKPSYEKLAKRVKDLEEAQRIFQETEQRLRGVFDNANDAIFVLEAKPRDPGFFLEANDVACQRLGYSRDELVSMRPRHIEDHLTSFDYSRIESELANRGQAVFETVEVTKNGTRIPVEISIRTAKMGEMNIWVIVSRDITERKQAEETLKKSEEKYRHLFNSGNDAVMVFLLTEEREIGPYIDVNNVACSRYGYTKEEFLKLSLKDVSQDLDEKRYQEIRDALRVDRQIIFESIHAIKDGTTYPVEVNANTIELGDRLAVISVVRDISDRKQAEGEKGRLQAQLHKALRMEAVGTLAGGVAHDFNNLLMGIQGCTSLLLNKTDPSHPHYNYLKKIERYVDSAADLTKQLLGFARGGKYDVRPTDLNDLLMRTSKLFGRTRKELRIHTTYQEKIWTVQADRSQIEQVLLNLYLNASQSMPGAGDLYLETENMTLDAGYVKPFPVNPGRYVKISVTDTGTGMDKETQAKVFEPFFTTKVMGRGTGLGLASAYGIIKNHSGIINVYSEKGKGTTFNIYLPASDKPLLKQERVSHKLLRGTETILLVDDEGITIEVGLEILKELGYWVLTAKTGKDALDLYMKHGDKIDLVILDIIMPGMGGRETFDKLKEMDPEVRVLLSSGYSMNGEAQKIRDRGCDGFIQKPFGLNSLSQKIREILDKK
jgi:two-component system cell cycle sensor histidine kinase/response regulator CckA